MCTLFWDNLSCTFEPIFVAIITLFHPKKPKFDKPFLFSSLPKIHDTFLVNKNLFDVIERSKNIQSSPIYQNIADSGLLEATSFPATIT